MKTNVKRKAPPITTAEGAPAKRISALQQLRRSVMSSLLWEKGFYVDGNEIAERVKELVAQVSPEDVVELAAEAREDYKLRHMPLLLLRELARHPKLKDRPQLLSRAIARVCQRADEPAELLALYWAEGRTPISKQVRRGLGWAMRRFNEYELAKYNREGAIRLRDVLFMTRPEPKDEEQAELWKKLAADVLKTPDTWETELSAGKDKKVTFTRLIKEGKLGYLALLRNLRNMAQSGVDDELVKNAILARRGADKVLPFRFIAAAKAAPQYENALDIALQRQLEAADQLPGKTIVLVDVSGSMNAALSGKSDMNRLDAACGVAIVAREMSANCRVFAFSTEVAEIPARRGMALRDAISTSMPHSSTYLGQAIATISKFPHDRLIVITDEQSADAVPNPVAAKSYMINIASDRNGVGYGKWIHLDGFSEAVIRFIQEYERDAD